ncbi:hypothetical protein LI686_001896 [Escherichia coli]|nr:hypothetical protein [Escherichia coli]
MMKDKGLTDDVLDEIIAGAKTSMEQYLALSLKAERAAKQKSDSNSPVTPDGWVMVPEDPTHEMLEAGDEQFGTYDVYRRMIEAAPKLE